MAILTGDWENWIYKTKDGKTKPTSVYVVRRNGKMVSWTKQDNLDKLNKMLYDYEPENPELPEGLYYQYHISFDVDPNPRDKSDYDDILDIRFSSKTRLSSNRIMGTIINRLNNIDTRRDGERQGAINLVRSFNWTTLKSKNNYKLTRSIDMGISTQAINTQAYFKKRRI